MKRFIATLSIAACFGLNFAAFALSDITLTLDPGAELMVQQGQVMKCSPPKFLLVSEVDMKAKTLTGMSTIERKDGPTSIVSAFHMTFNLPDIKVTDARRVAMGDTDLSKLKGKLVVLYDGKEPLSAPYLALLQEDTIVVSLVHPKE